jgi:hypothetical protein
MLAKENRAEYQHMGPMGEPDGDLPEALFVSLRNKEWAEEHPVLTPTTTATSWSVAFFGSQPSSNTSSILGRAMPFLGGWSNASEDQKVHQAPEWISRWLAELESEIGRMDLSAAVEAARASLAKLKSPLSEEIVSEREAQR